MGKVMGAWKKYASRPEVALRDFEADIGKMLRISNALAINSGTSALHLALKAFPITYLLKGHKVLFSISLIQARKNS